MRPKFSTGRRLLSCPFPNQLLGSAGRREWEQGMGKRSCPGAALCPMRAVICALSALTLLLIPPPSRPKLYVAGSVLLCLVATSSMNIPGTTRPRLLSGESQRWAVAVKHTERFYFFGGARDTGRSNGRKALPHFGKRAWGASGPWGGLAGSRTGGGWLVPGRRLSAMRGLESNAREVGRAESLPALRRGSADSQTHSFLINQRAINGLYWVFLVKPPRPWPAARQGCVSERGWVLSATNCF